VSNKPALYSTCTIGARTTQPISSIVVDTIHKGEATGPHALCAACVAKVSTQLSLRLGERLLFPPPHKGGLEKSTIVCCRCLYAFNDFRDWTYFDTISIKIKLNCGVIHKPLVPVDGWVEPRCLCDSGT
jgi:hypothetical protein